VTLEVGAMIAVVLGTLVVGRALQLRVLVPSWRFFDRADAPPTLWLAHGGGPWQLVEPPRRGLLGWAFSPASNLALAYQATVDRLVAEVSELDPATPDDAPAITSLRSYAIVSAIARDAAPPGATFRWKVVNDGEDFLASGELAA